MTAAARSSSSGLSAAFCLFAIACGGGDTETSHIVGPEGGQVRSEDGQLVLDIPPGALETDMEIGVHPLPEMDALGGVLGGTGYELSPDGLRFSRPATLTLHFSEDAVPADETAWPAVATSVVDENGAPLEVLRHLRAATVSEGTVTATIGGFSRYSAVARPPSAPAQWAIGQIRRPSWQPCTRSFEFSWPASGSSDDPLYFFRAFREPRMDDPLARPSQPPTDWHDFSYAGWARASRGEITIGGAPVLPTMASFELGYWHYYRVSTSRLVNGTRHIIPARDFDHLATFESSGPRDLARLDLSRPRPDRVELRWDLSLGNPTGYRIDRSPAWPSGGSRTVSAFETSFTDTGLDPALDYFYRVTPFDDSCANRPLYGGHLSASTTAGQSPPARVTNLTARAETNGVTLEWVAGARADTFEILRRDAGADAATATALARISAPTSTYLDASAVAESGYVYTVRAANAAGYADAEVEVGGASNSLTSCFGGAFTLSVDPPLRSSMLEGTARFRVSVEAAGAEPAELFLSSDSSSIFYSEYLIGGFSEDPAAPHGPDYTAELSFDATNRTQTRHLIVRTPAYVFEDHAPLDFDVTVRAYHPSLQGRCTQTVNVRVTR